MPTFRRMRFLQIAAALSLVTAVPSFAEETTGEKVQAKTNDATRSVKKSAHQTGEALCTGTKADCAKQKVGNRATETKDAASDKASEVKNKVN